MAQPKYIINADGTVEIYHPDKIVASSHVVGVSSRFSRRSSRLPSPSSTQETREAICPTCRKKVKENCLANHLREVHQQDINDIAAASIALAMQSTSGELVPCFYCSSKVRADHLVHHLAKIHGLKVVRTKRAVPTASTEKIIPPAPTQSPPQNPHELMSCPQCQAKVRSDRLDRHIQNVHNGPTKTKTATPASTKKPVAGPAEKERVCCPKCQIYMRADDLQDHLRVSHKGELIRCPHCKVKMRANLLADHLLSKHGQKSPAGQKPGLTPTQTRKTGKPTVFDRQGTAEALTQSDHEARDGSKGLGHMRRDFDGTFGSFPLHDDYNDESSAD